jgi:hypothetical protein
MTDTRTEGSAVVDDRTGSADLETDARRQAGFRLWTEVLSGERTRSPARAGPSLPGQENSLDESTNHRDPT